MLEKWPLKVTRFPKQAMTPKEESYLRVEDFM